MFTRPSERFTVYDTPDDQGGGTPTAAASAQARIEAAAAAGATDPVVPDGTPETPAAPMTYERGKEIEQELKADRERWRPYEEALGGLSDQARAAALAAVPALGDDLAVIASTMAQLAPADRQYVASVLALSRTDPVAAAQEFEQIAQALRGDQAPEPVVDPDAEPEYMTRAEFEQAMREQSAQSQIDAQQGEIVKELTNLGYDLAPDADPVEKARVQTVLNLAADVFAGDLAKADELIGMHRQQVIDEFMAAKTADAARPSAPTAGGSPSTEQQLHTLDEAASAAMNRLQAAGFQGS